MGLSTLYQLLFPLSRNKGVSFFLILLSAILIVGQTLLTDGDPFVLWGNWLLSGACALTLWFVLGRFHLGGVSEGKSLGIAWPLMSVTQNFAYLYFASDYPAYKGMLQVAALMLIVSLALSIWQDERATVRCLAVGLLIGLSSALFPHTVLWLLLGPVIVYHTRSVSSRNIFSILTGTVLGLWIMYCYLFVFYGQEEADALPLQFAEIFNLSGYATVLQTFQVWQWLYLALMALLVIAYSISAAVLGTGHSVRASDSIMLLCNLSIAVVIFMCLDPNHTALYICQLSLFLGIQLSVHQANLHSSANEWWTILIILGGIGLSVFPLLPIWM